MRWLGVNVLALLGLAGCTTSRPLTLPSGAQGQAISCGGKFNSIADCYAKAGELCPAGYDVADAETDQRPVFLATQGTLLTANRTSRTLLVTCKRP